MGELQTLSLFKYNHLYNLREIPFLILSNNKLSFTDLLLDLSWVLKSLAIKKEKKTELIYSAWDQINLRQRKKEQNS